MNFFLFISTIAILQGCVTDSEEDFYASSSDLYSKNKETGSDGCFDVNKDGLVTSHPYGLIKSSDSKSSINRFCTLDNGIQNEVCIHPTNNIPYSLYALGVEIKGKPWDCIRDPGTQKPVWMLAGIPSTELVYTCQESDQVTYNAYLGSDNHNLILTKRTEEKTEEKVFVEDNDKNSGVHIFIESFTDFDEKPQTRIYTLIERKPPSLLIEGPNDESKELKCIYVEQGN